MAKRPPKPKLPGEHFIGERLAFAMNLAACPPPSEPLGDNPYCFSVWTKPGGKVIAHTDNVLLEDVRFVIHPSGFTHLDKTGWRTVFAWTVGTVIDPQRRHQLGKAEDWVGITFNPKRAQTFNTFPDYEPIYEADYVYYDSETRRGIAMPRRANPHRETRFEEVEGESSLLQLIDEIGGDVEG